jgi:hypothetical protein
MSGKVCKGCGESKPYAAFYKHSKMRDGHLNYCGVCEVNRKYVRLKRTKPVNLDATGFELHNVPTMPRQTVIAWAVERYGKVGPSPDDILMARWPLYVQHHEKPVGPAGQNGHVSGYHADSVEVDNIILVRIMESAPRCAVCATPMPGHHNRKYCGPDCVAAAARENKARFLARVRNKVTDAEKARIIALRTEDNMSLEKISNTVQRSIETIRKILQSAGARRGDNQRQGAA